MKNNYRLLPHAKMLYWLLMIMEQSTPHATLLASNSTGKHTCCGELWVSWLPNPRRPAVNRRGSGLLIRCQNQISGDKHWQNWQSVRRRDDILHHFLLFPRQRLLSHWSPRGRGTHRRTPGPAHNQGVPQQSWAEQEEREEYHHSSLIKLYETVSLSHTAF